MVIRTLLLLLLLAACQASTTRPPFLPLPEAARAEVELLVPEATHTLAEALQAESIPIARVEQRDGYLETGWLDAKTLAPTRRQPVGSEIVRVRAWVTPGKPGFSELEVETVFRPLLDPSRPERELDVNVPPDHPVGRRVASVVKRLLERYGEPVPAPEPTKGVPRADTTRPKPRIPADTVP